MDMDENVRKEFAVKDLYLAAALKTAGLAFERLDWKDNGKYAEFMFSATEKDYYDHTDRYWDRKLDVDAYSYGDIVREFKNRLYTEKR